MLKQWFKKIISSLRRKPDNSYIDYEFNRRDGTSICVVSQSRMSIPTESEQLTLFNDSRLILAGELQLKVYLEQGDYLVLVNTGDYSYIDHLLYGEYKKDTSSYHFYFSHRGETVLSKSHGQALYDELQSKPIPLPTFIN
ncbi:hypothetical protein FM037_03405 [Shewanella psychropiezotolerans]|uniref:Uncharacterized protein n=1 Tax=Shewanella psychropiezotolerans TaxID=2593655 RepID=A0ABX5WTP1_9GAMM|nr:hypothetical protein [Shewanella psychropiezotolerans]QDO82464.1 hypothetical protein FM037_03405 [Shewanella psychropiezotolerans]